MSSRRLRLQGPQDGLGFVEGPADDRDQPVDRPRERHEGGAFERLALAKLATRRFLPKPAVVPFPERSTAPAEARKPVTVDSVRKLLMELQLSGGDADLVRSQRLRLEQISEIMSRVGDPESLQRLQAQLQALEVEVRGAF